MLDIAFATPTLPTAGALALLVAEGDTPGGLWRAADEATRGAITRATEVAAFKGGKGKTCVILAPGGGLSRVVLVGIGKASAVTQLSLEQAAGHAAAALAGDAQAAIAADAFDGDQAVWIATGAALRSYRFDRYRSKEKPEDKPKLARLTVLTNDTETARDRWASAEAAVKGVYLARDLVTEPPNVLTPAELATRCGALKDLGVSVDVLGPAELTQLGFTTLLAASRGSVLEPRVVVMRWQGAPEGDAAKPIAFIGKGVTFDSGGISIKPAAGMEDMKFDMAGSAAVIGLMATLARRRARVDAIGMIGLAENMPSGDAMRPGDVVKTYSGQTVEIVNTDAEGRLVLCDLLWYCQEKFEPRFMVNLATLTGSIIVSLGYEYAGLFSNDDDLAQKLTAAGIESGEKLWRMPLGETYDKMIRSDIADMKNVGGRQGGSISAAQFLQRFVNGKPWAHLDIAGTAWETKDSACAPKGATGYGVRLLDRLVATFFES